MKTNGANNVLARLANSLEAYRWLAAIAGMVRLLYKTLFLCCFTSKYLKGNSNCAFQDGHNAFTRHARLDVLRHFLLMSGMLSFLCLPLRGQSIAPFSSKLRFKEGFAYSNILIDGMPDVAYTLDGYLVILFSY